MSLDHTAPTFASGYTYVERTYDIHIQAGWETAEDDYSFTLLREIILKDGAGNRVQNIRTIPDAVAAATFTGITELADFLPEETYTWVQAKVHDDTILNKIVTAIEALIAARKAV